MVKQDVPLGYIDLHVHTTCSDGTLSPEKVVRLAASEKIGVLAAVLYLHWDFYCRAVAAMRAHAPKQ